MSLTRRSFLKHASATALVVAVPAIAAALESPRASDVLLDQELSLDADMVMEGKTIGRIQQTYRVVAKWIDIADAEIIPSEWAVPGTKVFRMEVWHDGALIEWHEQEFRR